MVYHIRRQLKKQRVSRWYKDRSDRGNGTYCGAEPTDRDIAWTDRPHSFEGRTCCPDCLAARDEKRREWAAAQDAVLARVKALRDAYIFLESQRDRAFAQSLLDRYGTSGRLSEKQAYWVGELTRRAEADKARMNG